MERNTKVKCSKCRNYRVCYADVGFCSVRNTYVDSGSVHYPDKCQEAEALQLLNMAMDLWYKRKQIRMEQRINQDKERRTNMKLITPFRTREEAEQFIKDNSLDEATIDGSFNKAEFSDYAMAVCTLGIDPDEYPFIVVKDCVK